MRRKKLSRNFQDYGYKTTRSFNLFSSLSEHILDQDLVNNHRNLLIYTSVTKNIFQYKSNPQSTQTMNTVQIF